MVLALSLKYSEFFRFSDKTVLGNTEKTRENIHQPTSLNQRLVEFVENLWISWNEKTLLARHQDREKKARIVFPIDSRSKSLIRFVSVFDVHQKIVNSIKFLTCTVDFRHRIKFVEIDLGWFFNSTVKCQVV